MTMLLLAVIALPGIDAGVTPLTDSNIRTAAQLWVSNEGDATSTYGPVHLWDVVTVTDMSTSKSIRIVENALT